MRIQGLFLFVFVYLPAGVLLAFLDLRRGGRRWHTGRRTGRADAVAAVMRRRTERARNAFETLKFLHKVNLQIRRA